MVTPVSFLFDSTNDWIQFYLPLIRFQRNYKDKYVFASYSDPSLVPDQTIVFILSYTKILKADFLKRNKFSLVAHPSALPCGKGFSALQWQILEGKEDIPVSLIEAAEEVDSGDIYDQITIKFEGHELHHELREAQATAVYTLVERFLDRYPDSVQSKPQIGEPTFYRRRTVSDRELDVNSSLKDLFPLLRISSNEDWPAFFEINGHRYLLKIYKDV